MTVRIPSLLPAILLVLVVGTHAPAASGQETGMVAEEIRRAVATGEFTRESERLRTWHKAVMREIESRRILKNVRPRSNMSAQELRDFYGRTYGFRLQPEFAELSDLQLDRIRLEIESTMKVEACRYGNDDVHDVYRTPPVEPNATVPFVELDSIQSLAAGVVAIVRRSALTRGPAGWILHTEPLETVKSGSFSFCEFDRFYSCPAADLAGTGFLVDEDLVATAGHIVVQDESGYEDFLDSIYFLFDYVNETEGVPDTVFADHQVYEGVEVLQSRRDVRSDWAVIRLDRPVEDREPLKIRPSGKISDGATLTMLGHPLGLPLKYAKRAEVLENETCGHFFATLDTYNLNSGSPVFNDEEGWVEGILVADAGDFEEVCDCLATTMYNNESGRPGARVTRATEISRFLDRPDSMAITCVIQAGAVIIDGETANFVRGDTLVVPVPEQGVRLIRGFDSCYYSYDVLPGDLWKIAYFPGTEEVVMELVCFP